MAKHSKPRRSGPDPQWWRLLFRIADIATRIWDHLDR